MFFVAEGVKSFDEAFYSFGHILVKAKERTSYVNLSGSRWTGRWPG